MHGLKYLRFMTLGLKDIGIRKSEFLAKTQFLSVKLCLLNVSRNVFYVRFPCSKNNWPKVKSTIIFLEYGF